MILPASLIDARACVLRVCVARARVCAAEEAGRGRAQTAMGGRMGERAARGTACEHEGESEGAGQGSACVFGRQRSRGGGTCAAGGCRVRVRVGTALGRAKEAGARRRGEKQGSGGSGARSGGCWGAAGVTRAHRRAPGGHARASTTLRRALCVAWASRALLPRRECAGV